MGSWVKLICFLQQSFSSHVASIIFMCFIVSIVFGIAFRSFWLAGCFCFYTIESKAVRMAYGLAFFTSAHKFSSVPNGMLLCRIVCIGFMLSSMHFLLKVFPAILIEGKWAVGLSLYSVFSNNHFPLMCPNLYSLRTNSESFASLAKHCSIYMLFYCYSALHHLLHVILFC